MVLREPLVAAREAISPPSQADVRPGWWGPQVDDIYVDVANLTPELRERLSIPSCCTGAGRCLGRTGLCCLLTLAVPLVLFSCSSLLAVQAQQAVVVVALVLFALGVLICFWSLRHVCCDGVFNLPEPAPVVPPFTSAPGHVVRSTPVRHVLLLYNPNAGRRQAEHICSDVIVPGLLSKGVKTTPMATERVGHARDIALTCDLTRYDALVCMGGDGTFHEMVNGMLARADGRRVPVSLIPLGSGNGLAATLRQSMKRHGTELPVWSELDSILSWSVDRISSGKRAKMDLLELDICGKKMVAVMQVYLGLLGEVDILAEPYRFLGPMRLDLLSIWSVLKKHGRPFAYEITLPDGSVQRREDNALGMNVGLNQHFSDSMRATPQAQLDDGIAELGMVPADKAADELLTQFLQISIGAHDTKYWSPVTSVAFDFGGPGVLNVDGEILEHDGKLGLRVLPQAVELLVAPEDVPHCSPSHVGSSVATGAGSLAADEPTWRADPRRWRMLAIYCFGNMLVQAVWIGFAPAQSRIVDTYEVSATWVNMLSLCFMIAYVPCMFPASYAMDVHGCRAALLIGGTVCLAGTVVRAVVPLEPGFPMTLLLIGQIVCACSQPCFTNMPPKIAAVWFPAYQRALADTIASLSSTIGAAIGFLMSSVVSIQMMIYIQLGWCVLFMVLVTCFFESAPPIPSSPSSVHKGGNFWKELGGALRNWRFLCVAIAFSCSLGSFNSISTLSGQLVSPYGFTDDEASNLGVFTVGFGIIGAAIMTSLVACLRKYRAILMTCLSLSVVFGALGAYVVRCVGPPGIGLLNLAFAGLGFSAIPVMPLTFEAAVEAAYPTGEGTIAGLCISGANVLGIIQTLIVSHFLETEHPILAWVSLLALWALAVVVAFFWDEKSQRIALESDAMASFYEEEDDSSSCNASVTEEESSTTSP
eukprot:TRINITY_DN32100_c0_g1_i1.p1 TRINITY_DN32100_c0_g1~~TRINITY_DN32100_c0_g1_i1.p1  ORF type:complete len:930 (+),score=175.82 TRINITY_DN32100_c0_g1_i1:146-2935(+)